MTGHAACDRGEGLPRPSIQGGGRRDLALRRQLRALESRHGGRPFRLRRGDVTLMAITERDHHHGARRDVLELPPDPLEGALIRQAALRRTRCPSACTPEHAHIQASRTARLIHARLGDPHARAGLQDILTLCDKRRLYGQRRRLLCSGVRQDVRGHQRLQGVSQRDR